MEDIRQTKEWVEYLRSCGWVVEKIGRVFVFIKKIPLTPFSMMKIQRFKGSLDFSDLKRGRRKHKVVYTVIEPGCDPKIRVGPFRLNKRPFLPTKTVVVDLRKSENELWDDLSTNAKRILRKGQDNVFSCHSERSRGISVADSLTVERDLSTRRLGRDDKEKKGFYDAWKRAGKTWVMGRKRFSKLLDAFGEKASLWVSEKNGEVLSGILLLRSRNTANYFQTFTTRKGRGNGAHYFLVWQVILTCKKQGLKWFDFEGILDKRWPQKNWAGFSRFKKKFGGEAVTYPGSFTKWF